MGTTAATGTSNGIAILARKEGASIAYQRLPAVDSGRNLPGVAFLGGFNSDMTGTKATWLEAFCAARGQAFIRFDYQGHGQSSGRFEDGTIGMWTADALAVLDALTEGPQLLIGSSMGGWISLLVALARPTRVAGLIGIAAAPDFVDELMWPQMPEAERARLMTDGLIRVASAYDPTGYVLTRALIEDGRQHRLLDRPVPLNQPVRLFHGSADAEVPWQLSAKLLDRLTSRDVTLTLVKDGDHRLSTPSDLARIGAAVAELSAL
ncbi:MAG TPA: alpha/beta hydrolase [Stellaceae bacterium]|nr:alpha/beta hydrolase [Stellaceae bacterium]